jgi:hypothetical protein
MPRLSLWRDNHSNDFKYFDKRISEMFTIGGTGVLIHKYLGTKDNPNLDNAEIPHYGNQSERNIQDLLFLENRDRKYDTSVYSMRGMYQVTDSDFSLEQFGLFLQTGTLFMTFHINDMVAILGRRIISGDVIEVLHLKDFEALTDIPVALKRFFIVGDASKSSEGYSPTWWPHLWRCKINPLVDSQEYKDIINQMQTTTNAAGDEVPVGTLGELLSTYNRYNDINRAIIEQAEIDLPYSGYDTSNIYTAAVTTKTSKVGDSTVTKQTLGDPLGLTADNALTADGSITADKAIVTPDKKVSGYLTGDGLPPNSLPVATGISFPIEPQDGDFCLRVDYSPNRLFRYDGRRWVKVEDAVRTSLTPGAPNNHTLKSGFTNNSNTFVDSRGRVQKESQGLSQALKPKADN